MATLRIALLSDTHSKHGSFAGFEVPESLWQEVVASSSNPQLAYLEALHRKRLETQDSLLQLQHTILPGLGNSSKTPGNMKPANPSAVLEQLLDVARKQLEDNSARSCITGFAEDRGAHIIPIMLLSGNKKAVVTEQAPEGVDLRPHVPYADILVHCGDFTMKGAESEVESFCQFLAQLPHPIKIVVAGNHDLGLDSNFVSSEAGRMRWKHLQSAPKDLSKRLKKRLREAGAIYLEDEFVTLPSGFTVFGSPIQPAYHDWAFQREAGPEMQAHYASVFGELPAEASGLRRCDLLVSHGPPLGRGDLGGAERLGCPTLLAYSQMLLRPKVHVFGHIHRPMNDMVSDDGTTLFVNCALTDKHSNLRSGKDIVKVVGVAVGPCERNDEYGHDDRSEEQCAESVLGSVLPLGLQANLLQGEAGPQVRCDSVAPQQVT